METGYQAVQSAHSAINFQYEHSELAKEWNTNSNYLIFLTVENEEELYKLKQKVKNKGIKYTSFYEPDIGNRLTAITLEPGIISKKLTSNLKLLR